MAGELQIDSSAFSGSTLYALLYNSVGQVCDTTVPDFENFVDANIGNYDILFTEQGTVSGFFRGDMPAVDPGAYSFAVRVRAGGAPAVTDLTIGSSAIFYWNGTSILAGGAVSITP